MMKHIECLSQQKPRSAAEWDSTTAIVAASAALLASAASLGISIWAYDKASEAYRSSPKLDKA